MDEALSELIRISNTVGKDPTLVQGGGGNTSVKTADGKYMYIKASGTALKDMNAKEGWRRLRLDLARSVVEDRSLARMEPQRREPEVVNRLLLACDDKIKTEARPSVEAHLHAWLNKCVIHLHPSAVGAYHNAKNGRAKLEKLFKDESLPPLWVPYTDPGFMLARRIARLVENYLGKFGKNPPILFLHKHGLFITAKTADGALRLVRRVIKRCNDPLRQPKAGITRRISEEKIRDAKLCIERAFSKATGESTKIWYYNNDPIADFLRQRDAKKMLSGSLTPDELVYANGSAMWVEMTDSDKLIGSIAGRLRRQIKAGRKHSVAFLVKGIGLFVAG
ncbi:MAG: class II aldolase, partial [Phycisphaerales bacterium]